jgi:hypothetical protein
MEEMLADGLMKSLAGGAFHEFSKMTLGGTWISQPVSVE